VEDVEARHRSRSSADTGKDGGEYDDVQHRHPHSLLTVAMEICGFSVPGFPPKRIGGAVPRRMPIGYHQQQLRGQDIHVSSYIW